MSDLKTASLDDLRKELAQREKKEFNRRNMPPEIVDNPQMDTLLKYAREIIEHVREHGYPPKDYKAYVFEHLMNAMVGTASKKDFWKWWNWRCYE